MVYQYSARYLFQHYLFGLLGWLASFSDGQGLLRSDDDGGASEGCLTEILAISLLNNQSLQLVQRPASSGLHCHFDLVVAGPMGLLCLLDGDGEALVLGSCKRYVTYLISAMSRSINYIEVCNIQNVI